MKYLPRQNIKLIIFDFDSSLVDLSEEILDSH
jgi:phosphoglycolate phosphatase-like HAD superfamily hydrolase